MSESRTLPKAKMYFMNALLDARHH